VQETGFCTNGDGVTEFAPELAAVVLTVTRTGPRLLVTGTDRPALPTGGLDAIPDRTLDAAVRHWVAAQTGLVLGYVEQLYTFGDLGRDTEPDHRRLTITYLAFVPGSDAAARWPDLYALFPWEDRRDGEADDELVDLLEAWVRGDRRARRVRADTTFGLHGAPWDPVKALERYELLYEAGLVGEAHRAGHEGPVALGVECVLDHRRIMATALSRVRGKLTYRPLVFELLASTFTLSRLQQVVEALIGVPLHTQNFRRLVDATGLVEGTGRHEAPARGRPAELFRFRKEVLRERAAPGLRIPRNAGRSADVAILRRAHNTQSEH
jgi:hypothetical protein